jgi:hypothetical protein
LIAQKVLIASKVLAVPEGHLDPFRPVFRMNVIHCHEGRKLPRPSSNAMALGFSSTGASPQRGSLFVGALCDRKIMLGFQRNFGLAKY